jgi:hypothetical protein
MTTTLDVDLTVETFANAVRGELFDLDAESIEDLTDGLEADLADKLADGEALGDPAAYAVELRAAAGLHPRRRRLSTRRLADLVAGFVARARELPTRSPRLRALIAFLTALRPLWWIFRAWVVFGVFNLNWMWGGVPSSSPGWVAFLGLCVLSVQWGRGKWLPWRWSRGFVVAVSVAVLLVAPVLVGTSISHASYQINPDDFVSEGVLLNRQQVTNIFAYGPDGKPLTGVQLFDQNGNPLSVMPDSWGESYLWDESLGDSGVLLPSDAVGGGPGWNVYPLDATDYGSIDPNTGRLHSWAVREAVPPPFTSVQPLVGG